MPIELVVQPIIESGVYTLVEALQGRVNSRVILAAYNVARRAQSALKSKTASWRPSPNFTISGGLEDGLTIGTDDLRFLWYDQGTKPHAITARRGSVMKLRDSGVARSPRSGSRKVPFTRRVFHPGIKARHVTDEVAADAQSQLEAAVDIAIVSALGG